MGRIGTDRTDSTSLEREEKSEGGGWMAQVPRKKEDGKKFTMGAS